MVKLAIFSGSDMKTFGGGEKYIAELSNRLAEFDTTIFSYAGREPFRQTSEGLKKFVKADIQYYNAPEIPLLKERVMLTLSGIATLRKLKEFDVVYCLDNSFLTNMFLVISSRMYGFKYVLGVHDANILRDKPIKDTALRRFLLMVYSPVRNFGIMSAANIRVINEEDGTKLKKLGYNGQIYSITDFINVSNASPKVDKSKFVVLFVGRLSIEHKGIDLLDKIIDQVCSSSDQIYFDIVGSGDNGEDIVKETVRKHKENVRWLGFVDEKKLIQEYSDSGLLIFPSRFESFGLSLAEGQAYGLPAVAFDVRGPDVIMKDKLQGKLITPFDTQSFSAEVINYYNLWKKDKVAYLKLKHSISKIIIDRFGEDVILPKVRDMFLKDDKLEG